MLFTVNPVPPRITDIRVPPEQNRGDVVTLEPQIDDENAADDAYDIVRLQVDSVRIKSIINDIIYRLFSP